MVIYLLMSTNSKGTDLNLELETTQNIHFLIKFGKILEFGVDIGLHQSFWSTKILKGADTSGRGFLIADVKHFNKEDFHLKHLLTQRKIKFGEATET